MTYHFTLTFIVPATPKAIYDAWLDSAAHAAMTGGPAKQSTRVGDVVSAWGGYITGRNLALVPGAAIVQSWRTTEFTDAHADSTITVLLEPATAGTRMTVVHANVPKEQTGYEKGGWQDNYFIPMVKYFTSSRSTAKKPAAKKPAAKKPTAKKPTAKKPTAKKPAAKKRPKAKR